MWKGCFILVQRVLEYPCVMCRTWPSGYYGDESHVKVTYRHHILCCITVSTNMVNHVLSWNNNRYVRPINSTDGIVEVRIKPSILQSLVHICELRVNWSLEKSLLCPSTALAATNCSFHLPFRVVASTSKYRL